MRSTAIVTALFAAGALSQPLVERDEVVVTQVNTVTKMVVVDSTGPSPAPQAPAVHENLNIKHSHAPAPAPAPAPSSAAPAPVVTPVAAPSADVSVKAAPSSDSSSSSAGGDGTMSGESVAAHNQIRSQHQAGAVTWSDDLAQSAQALAATCQFQHDVTLGPASQYGQNIASSYGTSSMHDAIAEAKSVISDAWYTKEAAIFEQLGLYGVDNPLDNDFDAWGHFSQEVWQATTQIGCAVQECASWNGYFTVCNYASAGNFAGEFAQNVLASN